MQFLHTMAASIVVTVLIANATTVKAASLIANQDTRQSEIREYRKPISRDLADKLQASLDKAVKETGVGATVGIVTPQGTWFGASGVSNRETGTPMQLDNLFHTGSINKTFMAALALKLQEQGKLNLDDTLGKWLPDVAKQIPDGNSITIRQLINGSAGVKALDEDFDEDIKKDPSILLSKDWKPLDGIAYIYGKPRFNGQKCSSVWCYPTTGTTITGLIVEKATGQPFATVFRNEVLKPLRMNNSFVGGVEKLPNELVRGYFDVNQDGNLVDVTEYDLGYAKPFGGFITTNVKDLMRFNQALFGGKFLKPESQKQLLSFVETGAQTGSIPIYNGKKLAFTYGLGVENLPSSWGNSLGKGGTTIGNNGQILYLPDSGIFAVELENAVNSKAPSQEFGFISPALNTFFAETKNKTSQSIPEPTSTVGLLGLGAVGMFLRLKRSRT